MHSLVAFLSSFSLFLTSNAYLTEVTLSSLRKRAVVADTSSINYKTYDFVICGGGLAGLVVAARLSENSSNSVLVLEAGTDGSGAYQQINIPAMAYSDGLVGTDYDWQYQTNIQPGLQDRELIWPRGKVLGGSSAINGEYLVKASSVEYDMWGQISQTDWNFANLAPYMNKAETYTPASQQNMQACNITDNPNSRGHDGPIHFSYPEYMYAELSRWQPALAELGVMSVTDQSSGSNWGAYITTSSINPADQTRSYSKNGYLDPNQDRVNLTVATNSHVTGIVWDCDTVGSQKVQAVGVQYKDASGNDQMVYVNKEVIVSGGVINSPQILELSGVGNGNLLNQIGLTTIVNLPGVGENLADHMSSQLLFHTSMEQTNSDLVDPEQSGRWLAQYNESKTGLYTYVNNAIAYPPLAPIFGSQAAATAHINAMQAELTNVINGLQGQLDGSVIAGLRVQWQAMIDSLYKGPVGQAEMLLNLNNGADQEGRIIGIQAAQQHQMSRGSVHINTTDGTLKPVINPMYGQFGTDLQMEVAALKFARQIAATANLSPLIVDEILPGANITADADWLDYAQKTVGTEYHPSGTCAMMPRNLGGVVAGNLTVWGTQNVRVIDASIIPFPLAAHLMATVYGVAERGSDMIKQTWNL